MNLRQTLVILIPGFPEDECDSNCLPAQQRFIRGINQYYPHLHIIIIAFQYPYREGSYSWYNNTVIAMGGKNRGGIARRILWRKASRQLDSLAAQYEICGVLSFWAGECAAVGKKWAVRNNVAFRCWVMGQDVLPGNKFIRSSDILPEEMIAISDSSAALLKKYQGISPAHIIPIGIDASWLPSSKEKKDITLLCAGSLIPLKRFDLAIMALKEIRLYLADASLIIAGDGPERSMLEKMVQDAGLNDHVTLKGETSHAEMLELMTRTRVFLHPSSFEGFSMACLEALGCGAEVVSFVQPMNNMPLKWHIANDIVDMKQKIISILLREMDPSPLFPYPLARTARDVMALFDIRPDNKAYSSFATASADK